MASHIESKITFTTRSDSLRLKGTGNLTKTSNQFTFCHLFPPYPSDELHEVNLSAKPEGENWRNTAVAVTLPRKKEMDKKPKKKKGFELSLDNFIKMIELLPRSSGVRNFSISKKTNVWIRPAGESRRLSLRESYDGTVAKKRQYVFATFKYQTSNVCLW